MEKYEVLKKLGEGGFGKVFLAKLKRTGKTFVVKELDCSEKENKKSAMKEIDFLEKMAHPNIIGYKEWFEKKKGRKNLIYIAMDFADGGDLEEKIKKQRGRYFREKKIVDWTIQICLALKHIHDRKILHRDIKSQNVFLMKNGMVKLGDFGIAKTLKHTEALAKTQIGTPYYLSPEICKNKPYANKSDMWAVGVLMYELCCLRHPFLANSMEALVRRICNSNPPPMPRTFSANMRNLVMKLLNKNPKNRPTVNTVLRKKWFKGQIERFLTSGKIQEEFSHTVIHGPISYNDKGGQEAKRLGAKREKAASNKEELPRRRESKRPESKRPSANAASNVEARKREKRHAAGVLAHRQVHAAQQAHRKQLLDLHRQQAEEELKRKKQAEELKRKRAAFAAKRKAEMLEAQRRGEMRRREAEIRREEQLRKLREQDRVLRMQREQMYWDNRRAAQNNRARHEGRVQAGYQGRLQRVQEAAAAPSDVAAAVQNSYYKPKNVIANAMVVQATAEESANAQDNFQFGEVVAVDGLPQRPSPAPSSVRGHQLAPAAAAYAGGGGGQQQQRRLDCQGRAPHRPRVQESEKERREREYNEALKRARIQAFEDRKRLQAKMKGQQNPYNPSASPFGDVEIRQIQRPAQEATGAQSASSADVHESAQRPMMRRRETAEERHQREYKELEKARKEAFQERVRLKMLKEQREREEREAAAQGDGTHHQVQHHQPNIRARNEQQPVGEPEPAAASRPALRRRETAEERHQREYKELEKARKEAFQERVRLKMLKEKREREEREAAAMGDGTHVQSQEPDVVIRKRESIRDRHKREHEKYQKQLRQRAAATAATATAARNTEFGGDVPGGDMASSPAGDDDGVMMMKRESPEERHKREYKERMDQLAKARRENFEQRKMLLARQQAANEAGGGEKAEGVIHIGAHGAEDSGSVAELGKNSPPSGPDKKAAAKRKAFERRMKQREEKRRKEKMKKEQPEQEPGEKANVQQRRDTDISSALQKARKRVPVRGMPVSDEQLTVRLKQKEIQTVRIPSRELEQIRNGGQSADATIVRNAPVLKKHISEPVKKRIVKPAVSRSKTKSADSRPSQQREAESPKMSVLRPGSRGGGKGRPETQQKLKARKGWATNLGINLSPAKLDAKSLDEESSTLEKLRSQLASLQSTLQIGADIESALDLQELQMQLTHYELTLGKLERVAKKLKKARIGLYKDVTSGKFQMPVEEDEQTKRGLEILESCREPLKQINKKATKQITSEKDIRDVARALNAGIVCLAGISNLALSKGFDRFDIWVKIAQKSAADNRSTPEPEDKRVSKAHHHHPESTPRVAKLLEASQLLESLEEDREILLQMKDAEKQPIVGGAKATENKTVADTAEEGMAMEGEEAKNQAKDFIKMTSYLRDILKPGAVEKDDENEDDPDEECHDHEAQQSEEVNSDSEDDFRIINFHSDAGSKQEEQEGSPKDKRSERMAENLQKSLGSEVETLRTHLEHGLGTDDLIKIYEYFAESDRPTGESTSLLQELLPPSKHKFIPDFLKLHELEDKLWIA